MQIPFSSKLNESGLALFIRPDFSTEIPRLAFAPIGGGQAIDDLSVIAPNFLGDAPFSDSLNYILVRESARGWIGVWGKSGADRVPDNPSCTYILTVSQS